MLLKSTDKFIELFRFCSSLKGVFRNNWVSSKSKESVADHCWSLSLMLMLIHGSGDISFDLLKAIKMSLIHDLSEIITGDLIYSLDSRLPEERNKKIRNEFLAINKINRDFFNNDMRLVDIWKEYSSGSSFEARLVKSLDKLDFYIQRIVSGQGLSDEEKQIFKEEVNIWSAIHPFVHRLFSSVEDYILNVAHPI